MIKKITDKLFTKEVISYLFFGVATTVVNMVVFWLFTELIVIHYLAANVIAWVIAVAFAYITNKLFVFESKSFEMNILKKEIPGFVAARVLSLLFETAFLLFAVELLKSPEFIAKVIAAVVVVIINYVARKLFIFKK